MSTQYLSLAKIEHIISGNLFKGYR